MAMFLSYTLEENPGLFNQGYKDGYLQSLTDNIDFDPSDITWADGTNVEIKAMVKAADMGAIDLTEYWSVGDERTVHLNAITSHPANMYNNHDAEDVVWVLAAADTKVHDSTNPCYNYQYINSTVGRTYPSFIVAQKNCLKVGDTYGSTATYGCRWNNAPIRTWCNDYYSKAINGVLKSIFKSVGVFSSDINGDLSVSDGDCFFLPAIKEVIGSTANSCASEANALSLWPYYSTASNRIKTVNGGANRWWTRSGYYTGQTHYCYIDSQGSYNQYTIDSGYGLAPCGCI